MAALNFRTIASGIIRVAVHRWRSQPIDTATVAGAIELQLPADTAARLSLSLVTGSITSTFPSVNWNLAGISKKSSS